MVTLIRPEEWIPSHNITLEDNAEVAVRSNFNSFVVAGPGAGKTELLAQRACFLLQTNGCESPKRILAISFKRDASFNLSDRVEKRCGNKFAQRFDSYTYDAFAKSMLDKFINAIPVEYRPSRHYEIIFPTTNTIQDLLFEISIPHEWKGHTIHEINAGRLLNRLCIKKLPLVQFNAFEEWVTSAIWDRLLNNGITSQLTFPMITRLVEYLLRQNPIIVKALHATYSHIFLDEFQDTTYIQYDLLKTAFLDSTAILTAVGDTKQTIMGWAGAVPKVFERFSNDFNGHRLDLIRNHRSAPILVNIQQSLAVQLDPDTLEVIASGNWDPADGSCEILHFNNYSQEAKILARQIYQWIEYEGIEPRKIVILAKQHVDTYGDELITELTNLGVKARVESELQDILVEPVVQIIIRFIRLAAFGRLPEDWQAIVDLLRGFCGYNDDTKSAKSIELEKKLENFLFELKTELNNIDPTSCNNHDLDNVVNKIVEYVGESSLKNHFPQYKKSSCLDSQLTATSSILSHEYQLSGDWSTAIDDFVGKNTIPIMTIHKSKGLEYDIVVFIGLEDGAFWSFLNQQHSDTCAFFVALSRAKRKVYFTYCDIRRTRRGNKLEQRINIDPLYQMLINAGVQVNDYRQEQ